MRIEELDYSLPESAVAQHPTEPRDAARLLVAVGHEIGHSTVAELPCHLAPGDLLVVNDTRVLPARLHLFKKTGGAVEVMLLTPATSDRRTWEALVRPGRRTPTGTVLYDHGACPVATVGASAGAEGQRLVELDGDEPVDTLLARIGAVPLPPYIHEPLTDGERYQTVFARDPGSVAAPTAGLHLTLDVLERCRQAGVEVAQVTLEVGLATFQPITSDVVESHRMHVERYEVPAATLAACREARRVVAVGTTTLRALESAAASGQLSGSTGLFIHGDYDFRLVDVLLTNFHLPRSSLLALLGSFAGERWRDLYKLALAEGYRFLSFGDAMLVDRQ